MLVQETAPPRENVPALQARNEVEPAVGQYDPIGALIQVEARVILEYVPALHAVHTDAPVPENKPALHARQADAEAAE